MSAAGESDGASESVLEVGDVVIVDRSVGSITAKTYATVVAIDERGPRLVGPDYPNAAFGAALDIERVTSYDRLVGRDGDGAFHLLRRSPVDNLVLDVVTEPGSEPTHTQPIADDDVLAEWAEHVDEVRAWDTVSEEFGALLDDIDRGDSLRTDGGQDVIETDLATTPTIEEITLDELRRRQQQTPDFDGEYEYRCPQCQAACTQSPTQPTVEYGHRTRCPRRPDQFPNGEPQAGRPITSEVATDRGETR